MTTTPSSPTDAPEGSTPPGAPHEGHDGPGAGPRVSREDITDLSRLRRTVGADRKIGGVAGGLARHFDVDPLLVRVLLVVLALFGGAGLVLYLALWLFVPEEYTGRAVIGTRDDTRKVLIIVAGVVGLLCLGAGLNDASLWPLAVVAGGALVFLLLREQRRPGGDDRTGTEPPTPGRSDWSGYTSTPYGRSMTGWVRSDTGGDTLTDTPATETAGEGGGQPPYADYRRASSPRRPTDPRRRGPILFWWVLATIALVLGSLGMIDMAGADLPSSVYPATALGIIAGGLLLGAFWGRAGGLILLGFIALLGTAAATASDRLVDSTHAPTSAALVRDHYRIGAGTMLVDLSKVSDPAELDGRQIRVTGGAAQLVIVVPDDMDVAADAVIDGPGEAIVFNQRDGNLGLNVTGERDVQHEVGQLEIHAEVHIGEIDIVTPAEYALNDYGTRK